MRERKEIEADAYRGKNAFMLLLEVLLDMRDQNHKALERGETIAAQSDEYYKDFLARKAQREQAKQDALVAAPLEQQP